VAKKLIPVGERCLVIEDKPQTIEDDLRQKYDIVIVHTEKDHSRPTTGKVVAVGNGPLINEMLQVGDTVFFAQYAGTYTTVENVRYRNLLWSDITDVLRDEEDLSSNPSNEMKEQP
jgi:co-chaperonin GroES (HSP10)